MTAPGPIAVLIATQNLNAVLRIMQWGVIALIFLFFLRVIRAVWVEMSPATIRKPRSSAVRSAARSSAAVRARGPTPTQPPPPAVPQGGPAAGARRDAPTTSTTS